MRADTVILVPTYNERENIKYLVEEIAKNALPVRVLVIDDNSPDGTADVVRSLQQEYPWVSLLLRIKKEGLGAAYRDGMERVLKDPEMRRIMTMDADGSHPVESIRAMLEASEKHDLVIGSRYVRGGGIEDWERWRLLLSTGGNWYARLITGMPVHDMTAGFMCFRADLLRKIDMSHLRASGYAFLMELKYTAVRRLHARVVEVPIIFKTRREGESKISHHIIREGLLTPWRLRLSR